MSFKKGEILTYVFYSDKKSKVIRGYHRAIVLHERETPYKTVMIAAITSLSELSNKGKVPNNYLLLKKDDYPMVLNNDSYVNLDMIATVDRENLQYLQRYNKKIAFTLNDEDLFKLDYKLALTYELQSFINKENTKAINHEIYNIVEYIDKDIREKVDKIIEIISDDVAMQLLRELIDKNLIEEIKETYNL